MYQFQDILNGDEKALANSVNGTPTVEPLQGPLSVADVFDRFPESVYQQGKDTHLYHLLEALCGDAGAGMLKKQAFQARLLSEAEYVTFRDLDDFYGNTFKFRRLKSEVYTPDTDLDSITEAEWDDIRAKDDAYKHRVQDFLRATRLGSTPDGMELAAESGSGIETEIIEHYKYIFDLYSDDPLGIIPLGRSNSVNEFVVQTHIFDHDGNVDTSVTYQSAIQRIVNFDTTFQAAIVTNSGKEALIASLINTTEMTNDEQDADPLVGYASKKVYVKESGKLTTLFDWGVSTDLDVSDPETFEFSYMLPELERNMVGVLDRLRPVGALISVDGQRRRYLPVLNHAEPFGTSERIVLSRFVSGNSSVVWPAVDRGRGTFIVADQERQMIHGQNIRELPVIFQTVDGVHASDDRALNDPTYNTADFYIDLANRPHSAPFYQYVSEHTGQYHKTMRQLFPFLRSAPDHNIFTFSSERAIAINNTDLIMEGRV